MRPLQLTMQAFGPYAGKVNVDFEKLGDHGLYLITGDTGAGKSTIFDGITYALFDKTSLEEREPVSLRSKYATQDTITKVELTFLYDGKKYKITRTPQYGYINRNGKPDTKDSTVELTLPDNTIFSGKKKETNKRIVEIIGLEYDQFKRIVMIAQGDFKKLLLDKSGRVEIFRKIFNTEPYENLQNLLKEDRKNLKKDCEASDNAIKQNIKTFYYDEKDPLYVELSDLQKQDAYNLDMIKDVVSEMNANDNKQIDSIKENINKIENQLTTINKEIGVISQIKKAQEELAKAKEDQKQAILNSNKLQEKYDQLLSQKPTIDNNKKDLAIFEKDLAKYKELDNRREELIKLKEKLEKDIKIIEDVSKKIKDKNIELDNNKKEFDNLKDIDVEYQKTNATLEKQSDIFNQLNDLETQITKFNESINIIKTKENEYIVASKEAQVAIDKYNQANQLFLDNQAGVLAQNLEDNKPCPVCGSLNHPTLAKSLDNAPSEEDLKTYKKEAEELSNKQTLLSNNLNKIKGELESTTSNLKQNAKKLLIDDNLDNAPSLVEEKIKETNNKLTELKNQLKELETKQKTKEQLDQLIQNNTKVLEEHKTKLNDLEKSSSSTQASIESKENELDNFKAGLHFDSLEIANAKIDSIRKTIESYDNDLNQTEEVYKKAKENVDLIAGSINNYEKQLKENKIVIDDTLEDKKNELIKQKNDYTELSDDIKKRLNNNERTLNNIIEKYNEIETTHKKLSWINALCDTANATINGKEKITFETYIQTTYFDRILAFGNKRLEIMTDNQYSFVRGKEGLELNVVDHYNGTEREVSTLSGGESFMASLSLALGMSDEVQSRAASIQIDTLFVDEGFGSLDNESLNKAINALNELSQGNRLVGIISHVDELKNRIDKKIIVTKDKANGSVIELEV